MQIAVFSTKPYDRVFLTRANDCLDKPHKLEFHEAQLNSSSCVLAQGCDAVCCFVNDKLDASVLQNLAAQGIQGPS